MINIHRFDEPAECLDCGFIGEVDVFNKCTLDAYNDMTNGDYDLFCPRCDKDNLIIYAPKEDRPRNEP